MTDFSVLFFFIKSSFGDPKIGSQPNPEQRRRAKEFNGDGTGAGSSTSTAAAVVKVQPNGYSGSTSWSAGYYTGGTTANTGYGLPATDNVSTGVGDPCRLYLGAPWRTPTADELAPITGQTGSNAIAWLGVTGRWVTSSEPFDGVSGPVAWFGPGLSAGSGTPSPLTNPFFPASGYRHPSKQ